MKMLKSLMVGVLALSLTTVYAEYTQTRDSEAIQKFIKEQKRDVTLRGKSGGELAVGGDVAFEYQSKSESIEGAPKRGSGTGEPNIIHDIEADLYLDYKNENSFASTKLAFDNHCGIDSGTDDSIELEKALIGMTVMEEGASRLEVMLGRDVGYNLMDSEVQFDNYFDGAFLKYSNSFEDIGDAYIFGGGILEDNKYDNYAWLVEAGLMDIVNTGLYAKYSFIHWRQKGFDRTGVKDNHAWRFANSQFSGGYVFKPEVLKTEAKLFGAYIINHDAEKIAISNFKKKNTAWYAGVKLGEVKKAGDWSVKADWQHVGAQAIMDSDISGISSGNVVEDHFYTDHAGKEITDMSKACGNGNYKGYEIDAAFGLTDNIELSMEWSAVNEADKEIGGRHSSKVFELQATYAF